MLISPKRCSTRNISRLSDRLAGRGTMRKCTEREGRFAAALRTDMAVGVRCEVLGALAATTKVRKWVAEVTEEDRNPGVTNITCRTVSLGHYQATTRTT